MSITVRDLQTFIEALETVADDENWTPSPNQWRKVREKIMALDPNATQPPAPLPVASHPGYAHEMVIAPSSVPPSSLLSGPSPTTHAGHPATVGPSFLTTDTHPLPNRADGNPYLVNDPQQRARIKLAPDGTAARDTFT